MLQTFSTSRPRARGEVLIVPEESPKFLEPHAFHVRVKETQVHRTRKVFCSRPGIRNGGGMIAMPWNDQNAQTGSVATVQIRRR